jgi:hypothetical protein
MVHDSKEVAAAVVAIGIKDGATRATLPAALQGTALGESVAQESIALADVAVQQGLIGGLPPGLDLSRKRSADGELIPDPAAAGTVAEPRKRRRFLKGMEVVWKFFGVNEHT